jgi:zinc protease
MIPSTLDRTCASGVYRHRLANGLRVVVEYDPETAVVGVAMNYDVGSRSEPPDRGGFAHLFEHLMFSGSASLPRLGHARLIQGSGGSYNGMTQRDHTCYVQVVPVEALARALFVEADRARGIRLTAADLAREVAVVTEEVRGKVLARPYGGLPAVWLPPVLFDRPANAHDGYTDLDGIAAATMPECVDFFETYYSPGNAVLAVSGGVPVDEVLSLVEEHFAGVPARPVPAPVELDEPAPAAPRHRVQADPYAPLPALSVGWRAPDPVADPDGYVAGMVLAAVLAGGERGRLTDRLTRRQRLVSHVWAHAGLTGAPFSCRGPDAFVVNAILLPGQPDAAVLDAVDAELRELAGAGPTPAELAGCAERLAVTLFRELDHPQHRTLQLGTFELLHGRAELAMELPDRVHRVDPAAVARAASGLLAQHRAVLSVQPGSAR